MIFQEDLDFLAHFGVKGQKWGVDRAYKVIKSQKAKKTTDFLTDYFKNQI